MKSTHTTLQFNSVLTILHMKAVHSIESTTQGDFQRHTKQDWERQASWVYTYKRSRPLYSKQSHDKKKVCTIQVVNMHFTSGFVCSMRAFAFNWTFCGTWHVELVLLTHFHDLAKHNGIFKKFWRKHHGQLLGEVEVSLETRGLT
jgi:hypothetical protein